MAWIVLVPQQPQDDGLNKFATFVGIVAGLITIAQAFDKPKRRRGR
jgi:hypothetical protein